MLKGTHLKTVYEQYICYGGPGYSNAVADPEDPVAQDIFKTDLQVLNELTSSFRKGVPYSPVSNIQYGGYHYMRQIGLYFSAQYKPVSEDKEFLINIKKIGDRFIDAWYFGDIFVAYGQSFIEREKEVFNRDLDTNLQKPGDESPKVFPKIKFRLYIPQPDGKYRSILSNVEIKANADELVYAPCNEMRNFVGWMDILLGYLTGHETTAKCLFMSVKKLEANVVNEEAFQAESINFTTNDPVFKRNRPRLDITSVNKYENIDFFPTDDVWKVVKNNRLIFDEKAAFYGMVGKDMDQKAERVTVGENQMDMDLPLSLKFVGLEKLGTMCEEMKVKYEEVPDDFEINIRNAVASNTPMAQHQTLMTPEPNMEAQKQDQKPHGDSGK